MEVSRPVRVAELMAMVSSATDFAKGLPEEQALRTCRISMRLADLVGIEAAGARDVFYVSLLRFVGCTATAPEMAAALGDEIAVSALFASVDPRDLRAVLAATRALTGVEPRRLNRVVDLVRFMATAPAVIREHEVASCEVGRAFAARAGLPDSTGRALAHVFERWDGHGHWAGRAAPTSTRPPASSRSPTWPRCWYARPARRRRASSFGRGPGVPSTRISPRWPPITSTIWPETCPSGSTSVRCSIWSRPPG